jgi:hypothetical protein
VAAAAAVSPAELRKTCSTVEQYICTRQAPAAARKSARVTQLNHFDLLRINSSNDAIGDDAGVDDDGRHPEGPPADIKRIRSLARS